MLFFARLEGSQTTHTRISIGFGDTPAPNTAIVPAAIAAIASLNLPGGQGLLINGPVSIPAAFAIAHTVAHLYAFIAVWDPKLQTYIVAISHDPSHKPGDTIP